MLELAGLIILFKVHILYILGIGYLGIAHTSLVEICFFAHFSQDLIQKWQKIEAEMSYFCLIPKCCSTQKHWSSTQEN